MASENECTCGMTWHIVEWKPFPEHTASTPAKRRSFRKMDIFVAYIIEVLEKGRKYTVSKRFTEFYVLNKMIKPYCEGITLSFPPRTFMPPLDKATLDYRQRELNVFIKHLADHRVLRNCESVVNFFAEKIIDDTALVKRDAGTKQHSLDRDLPPSSPTIYQINATSCKVQIGSSNTQYSSFDMTKSESFLFGRDEELYDDDVIMLALDNQEIVQYRKAENKMTFKADEGETSSVRDNDAAIEPVSDNYDDVGEEKSEISQKKEFVNVSEKTAGDSADGRNSDQATARMDDNTTPEIVKSSNRRKNKHKPVNAKRLNNHHRKQCCSVQ